MAASLKTPPAKVTAILTKYLTHEAKLRFLQRCFVCQTRSQMVAKTRNTAALTAGSQKIVIPDKIQRSPTAILEALSATVKHNANTTFYMGIDDPYLIPLSHAAKKMFLASLESGRQSARKMIEENPEHYTQIWEDPLPEAWKNPYEGYKYEEPCEDALKERIRLRKVNAAFSVYKACKQQNEVLSQDTLDDLLELLCVFNCENAKEFNEIEEYLNPTYEIYTPQPPVLWKKGNIAEQLFNELPEKTPRAYCNLISGMANSNDRESAFAMYQEAKSLNVPIDEQTYNRLLSLASVDVTTLEDVVEIVQSVLKDMAERDVTPTVETFDAIISSCRRTSRWTGMKKFVLSVVAEMKACGIEPQLSTYHHLLCVFYYLKDKSRKSPEILEDILNDAAERDFEIKSKNDMNFFRFAMQVITTFFPDPSLALKLHSCLQRGQNSKALGHREHEFLYYASLLKLLATIESTDVIMDIYKSIVPHIFVPNIDVLKAIMENIEMHDAVEHIPWLFSDLAWANVFRDPSFTEIFVRLMTISKDDPQLQSQFSNIASTLLSQRQDEITKGRRQAESIYLDGSVVGNMIMIFLNNQEPEKAWEVLQLYQESSYVQKKDPSCESLSRLAEHSIEARDFEGTKTLLELMLNQDSRNIPSLVGKTLESFPSLSDQERNYLQGLSSEASLHKREESSGSDSD